jgi:NAD(P)-dependent dehydrogenase (short-subunit alcohol dehydrogenase family)
MQDKICLVTGATSGIGAVTAQELARRGATVWLVGRNRAKCDAAVSTIRERTGNASVEAFVAELSSQEEVRRLAEQVRGRTDRLDVLLNNAGGMFMQRRESADGIEMTWALNHLAYFLLTHRLLEPLKNASAARIVNVASEAHTWAKRIDFDDLNATVGYRGFRAYCQSKLANILFTYELARRLEGSSVTANALHPGFVATNIFAGQGWAERLMALSAKLFAISPQEGARTSIFLASAPEVEGITGRYFYREKPVSSSRASNDRAAATRLWEISEAMTGVRS